MVLAGERGGAGFLAGGLLELRGIEVPQGLPAERDSPRCLSHDVLPSRCAEMAARVPPAAPGPARRPRCLGAAAPGPGAPRRRVRAALLIAAGVSARALAAPTSSP